MIEQQLKALINTSIQHISPYEQLSLLEKNLGCTDGKIIGTGQADYTQGSAMYDFKIKDKTFALIDIPGIEGDESKFEDIIREALDKAHTIFYINGSGKKLERATLEKVKKYMHDGTSVYTVFNVHCKAKKERIPGIDKTFNEELSTAYLNQEEIINQTENELNDFLGENYKGSLSLNGLLAFCGYAVNQYGKTTIAEEENKNLRSDQNKYIKEYDGNLQQLKQDSRISLVQDIINNSVEHFDEYIYSENIKKLKNRLYEMITDIDALKLSEVEKIRGYISIYDDFKSNCYTAKENYIQSIKNIGNKAAFDGFETVKTELFEMIEKSDGKITSDEIQQYINSKEDTINHETEASLNNRMSQAEKTYTDTINDACQRLLKDYEREQVKFEISLSNHSLKIDDSFTNALKYTPKAFFNDLFKVGSLTYSFACAGSVIAPGLIGWVVGAAVGLIFGIVSCITNFFCTRAGRINNAKEKIQSAIDEYIFMIAEKINSNLKELNYEEKINTSYNEIYNQVEKQKSSLKLVEQLLNDISNDLNKKYQKLS